MKRYSILILVVTILSMSAFTIPTNDEKEGVLQDGEFVYDVVDEMPQFPGGEAGLKKYIQDHLVYPKRLKKEGIGGKVYVGCIIEKDGEVTNEQAYQGINRKLEYEALKVVQGMPNWIPGKHKGKVVRVKKIIPIVFK
ncbi:MAG: energy transducer TonB [Putridiphycobacter sp.]